MKKAKLSEQQTAPGRSLAARIQETFRMAPYAPVGWRNSSVRRGIGSERRRIKAHWRCVFATSPMQVLGSVISGSP